MSIPKVSKDLNVDRHRQTWMAVLAQAIPQQLTDRVATLGNLPPYQQLRPPETGLTMVRGRAGGTGQVFNLGEMTLTRCVVVLEAVTGFSYIAGRNKQHAELAALCDALLQLPQWHAQVYQQVIQPLEAAAAERQAQTQRETAATKVDFFTLLRGE
ncbi:MAG: phosphonate C-P lyase system protein PhnG [Cyanobacteria bacterium J06632_22]